ncbi:HAMP domain-containing histidine kinase [Pontixanthobacter aestiaquae]|uniref:histidine kinase n=1 Tax=Pontixanthobacter aestiaquae TaxID=1509367 RepID=A0A844Z839_9SPHN|nr:HAMP domain-containing histidine kinase [Pontixanthobacter aestiaquae]MDN3645768.1 HAMP domain-containing histidine kinase [Pontixanthobacter aestiaquae]MXO83237.1 sensor histidine kinase [Pontixanthobacter aestiaquae]
MHFDDRLATVLRHRAAGERAARTQFRQLLDLLGSKPKPRDGERDESLLAAAWLRLGALGEAIPADERAAMIRDPGLRFRSAELAAHLAEDEPEVAAAALGRADLTQDDWDALVPRLPVRARGFLRLRRDLPEATKNTLERLGIHDRGLPVPDKGNDVAEEPRAEATPAPPPAEKTPLPAPEPANDVLAQEEALRDSADETAIGALVKRIEEFRKARSDHRETADAPRLPLGEKIESGHAALQAFAFTADSTGKVEWADREVAPMMIGMILDKHVAGTALRYRQPIQKRQMTLYGAPLIAGEWVVDARPRFTKPDGRFFGYAGMFRRADQTDNSGEEQQESSEADHLRQLLHELRTPVNAIQGFSEVIQQQLFGPTPHEYRALAANIAGDSARMLAGFDELDRLARLETGALDMTAGQCDLGTIVGQQLMQLQGVLKPRTASFEPTLSEMPPVALDAQEAEALAWRLLATLVGTIGAGENIQIELAEQDGAARLCCELPVSLVSETDIFAATGKPQGGAISAGMFGAGFSLRLARAEARAAGGDLTRVDDWLLLTLPLLTAPLAEPSHTGSDNAA